MFEYSELDTLGQHPEMQPDGLRMVPRTTSMGALTSDTSIIIATVTVTASCFFFESLDFFFMVSFFKKFIIFFL